MKAGFLAVFFTTFVCKILCDDLVRVDLFVMAKCPDAYTCETVYAPVIAKVGSIVDLHLDYIAEVDPNSQTGFDCMHGEDECVGDIQQLCAYSHYQSNYTWWNFVLCEDQDQDNIPYNGEDCCSQSDMDYNVINNCATGSEGVTLMTNSINYTNSKNVQVSCTIYISDQEFCVHNGDWEDCKTHDLGGIIEYICSQYTGTNPPPACKGITGRVIN